jgi:CelD/BcsL family acetyltransferase involved in cellulose biosynthesis
VNTLALDVVHDPAALPGLRRAWQELWRRCPAATPFQSPEWLLPWWRQFGTAEPRIALLRAGEALLGMLPLYILRDDGVARLLPIGVGISDYLDALIAPEAPNYAAERLLACALDAAGISQCELPELPPQSRLRDAALPRGWQAELVRGETCPLLAMRADAVPARMRRKLRMSRHRADRAGQWEIEASTRDSLPDALDALMRLNDGRWQSAGVFADSRVRAFHAEAAPALLEAGLLRLMTLRLAGDIVAVIYALRDARGDLMLHLGGYDPAHGFISPGTLLIGAMLEQAAEEGAGAMHFLRGDEAYKYAWGAQDRHNAVRRFRR